ncbi:MAG: type II toxin-antitoxin system ParD family antitoxin [Chloroflexi bacterium]|nr:type II toxin-antitoxin system ParD family antitoxin [Chloroflexota bacterium]
MYVVDASVWVSRFITADAHHGLSHSWLQRQVESGEYASYTEVVHEALRLLEQRDKKLKALRQDIQDGLNSGPGRPFDESIVGDIKRRGRERLSSSLVT